MAAQEASVHSYCLRRKDHSNDRTDHFERLFREESMVDVTLFCGEGTIKAHKVVLSSGSLYFNSIFSKLTDPSHYPVVVIKDMPFEDLRAIIEFIYRGEMVVPQDQLPSILRSAEKLLVKGLTEDKHRINDEVIGKTKKRRRKKKRKGAESNGEQDMGNQEEGEEESAGATDYSDESNDNQYSGQVPQDHQHQHPSQPQHHEQQPQHHQEHASQQPVV